MVDLTGLSLRWFLGRKWAKKRQPLTTARLGKKTSWVHPTCAVGHRGSENCFAGTARPVWKLSRSAPDLFYKGRSQEKTHLLRLKVFLLLSPLERARSVLTYRTICSVAGQCAPLVWVFSTSGVHRFLATKPVSSETNKAEPGQILATIVLSGTRGP